MIEETLNNLKLINQLEILIPITILSVILVAISKSGFGGALGSLGLPVMVLAFPPKLAIAILLPLYLITDIFVAYTWRKFPVLKILKLMVLGGLLGQVLGWICFEYLEDKYILILIGILALITSIRYFKGIFFQNKKIKKIEKSSLVGEILAKRAKEKNIDKVYFDRGDYKYHGRIKVFAETLRKNGLKF